MLRGLKVYGYAKLPDSVCLVDVIRQEASSRRGVGDHSSTGRLHRSELLVGLEST